MLVVEMCVCVTVYVFIFDSFEPKFKVLRRTRLGVSPCTDVIRVSLFDIKMSNMSNA